MKKTILALVFVLACAGTFFAQADSALASASAKEKSLYLRLGGYDAIAAVSDDFIGRLATGKLLGRFVVGLSENSRKHLRQNVVDFLCNATGGPCLYLARDMKTSHKGLGITEADWKEAVDSLNATLDKFKVPKKERGEVLGAVSSLKGDIVEKP